MKETLGAAILHVICRPVGGDCAERVVDECGATFIVGHGGHLEVGERKADMGGKMVY